MLKDCANIKLPAISNIINRDEEFTVPMPLKPAMVEILRIHNSSTPIKPQDVEDMDACDVLNHLKAEDENIVSDICFLVHSGPETRGVRGLRPAPSRQVGQGLAPRDLLDMGALLRWRAARGQGAEGRR